MLREFWQSKISTSLIKNYIEKINACQSHMALKFYRSYFESPAICGGLDGFLLDKGLEI
jgi:hypothetical protein